MARLVIIKGGRPPLPTGIILEKKKRRTHMIIKETSDTPTRDIHTIITSSIKEGRHISKITIMNTGLLRISTVRGRTSRKSSAQGAMPATILTNSINGVLTTFMKKSIESTNRSFTDSRKNIISSKSKHMNERGHSNRELTKLRRRL